MVGDATKPKEKNNEEIDTTNVTTKSATSLPAVAKDQEKKEQQFTANEVETKRKSGRKRKRHIYNAIRAQMEFYFGDANLSKDRFLKQLINKDPFVPLETFLCFNKMKTLSQSVGEIAKSLTNSQLLELDETQQKVRRKTVLPIERNVDDKTLYVESLPANADHEWLREIFQHYGPVAYVSLPRYAVSRKIKEFAFIEYERDGCVEKAIHAFQQFNGVLQMQNSDPASLCSVRAFVREQQEKEQQQAGDIKVKAQHEDVTAEKKTTKTAKDVEERKSKKRRKEALTVEEDMNDTENVEKSVTKKRRKMEKDVIDAAITVGPGDSSQHETQTETNESEDNDNKLADATTMKRRRQKKNKSKSKSHDIEMDPNCFELKILPKLDWKRLRNKYLNLQRGKVAAIKRSHWRQQQQSHNYNPQKWSQHSTMLHGEEYDMHLTKNYNIENKNDDDDGDGDELSPTPAKRMKSEHNSSGGSGGSGDSSGVHKMSMNFYGAGGAEIEETSNVQAPTAATATKIENAAQQRTPLYTREPGLIVEINLLEPCVNIKDFKTDMRQYTSVKYVDIKEGATQACIRLETPTAAEEFVNQINCAEYKCKVLRGKAEVRYWKKIEQDREMKLNKKIKVPQKRGRERVKNLIAAHIRFDDDKDGDDEHAVNDGVNN